MVNMIEWIKKYNTISFSTKIVVAFISIGSLCLTGISLLIYKEAKQSMLDRTTNQLLSVNILKKKNIEHTIKRIESALIQKNKLVVSSIETGQYIPIDTTNFGAAIVLKEFVYLSTIGNEKEYDKPTRIALTNKSLLYQIKSTPLNQLQLLDISEISFSNELKLLFVYTFKKNESTYTVLYLIQPSIWNDVVEERSGLGETGESYIVRNKKMRTRSRFIQKSSEPITVATEAVLHQDFSNHFKGTIKDYRGVDVISVSNVLILGKMSYKIISEIDWKEAMIPIHRLKKILISLTIVFSILLGGLALLLTNQVTQPVKLVNTKLIQIAGGYPVAPIQNTANNKEVGELYGAINQLIDTIDNTIFLTENIGKGNYSVPLQPKHALDKLGNALSVMKNNLIESRKKEILLMSQNTKALIEGQEKERERIARDLHDGLGQLLTALRLQIGVENNIPDTYKKQLMLLIDESIQEVRRISRDVMPTVLVDFGLEAGLRHLIDTIQKSSPQTTVELYYINDGHKSKTPYEIRINLYRIAQEVLNNALKYANASIIEITVVRDNHSISMDITDNGKGFIKDSIQSGKGLVHIKERTQMLQGTCSIESEPGKGTHIQIEIPTAYE